MCILWVADKNPCIFKYRVVKILQPIKIEWTGFPKNIQEAQETKGANT